MAGISQDQILILAFKIVLVGGVVSAAVFVGCYHRLTRGAVWADAVGRTIVLFDLLIALCLVPAGLPLFWHFSRFASHLVAWVDVVLFGLIPVALAHRTFLWVRIHNQKAGGPDNGGEA